MASSLLLGILISTLAATAIATATGPYANAPAIHTPGEKNIINFKFNLRQILRGPNATRAEVVTPLKNYRLFGQIIVFDDYVTTTGPDARSKVIGRSQGFFVGTSMNDTSRYVSANIVFIEGPHCGSTLAVVGRMLFQPMFELIVVGGTGKFLLVQGNLVLKEIITTPEILVYLVEAQVVIPKYT